MKERIAREFHRDEVEQGIETEDRWEFLEQEKKEMYLVWALDELNFKFGVGRGR